MYTDDNAIRDLYRALIDAWNRRDAKGMAAVFSPKGVTIGFDGSVLAGAAEIESAVANIFAHHPTPPYVTKIEDVRFPASGVAIVRAIAGMAPPGQTELNPALNSVQTMIAVWHDSQWLVESFQNTPAAFHGRPELVERMVAELRAVQAS